MSNAEEESTLPLDKVPGQHHRAVETKGIDWPTDKMTVDYRPAKPPSGLHVRCPHCHNPIELLPDAKLETINCTICGSNFSLTEGDDDPTRDTRGITQVGHFKLVERLGIGGFGAVWKAYDSELDRTVAIKIPRSGQLDKLHQDLFMREARSAAQLRHPNIVPVYEVGRDGDTLYIVSEFVRGITLSDRLTSGPLSAREAVEICAKVADALHHAHEQGVIHRDLKPANVMLDADGEPHLMDFGLARREANEITMTIEGQVLGTPAYMSPEQAQGEGHTADRRSDVYSVGVMLFQLVTGELPFRGNSRMLIHQVIHDEPPSPRKLNSAVPRDLETVTLKCMEKSPNRRFATAKELGDEFRRYLGGEPIHSRPITKIERAWRWANRKPGVAALTAVVLGLLTFVAVAAPIVAVQQSTLRKIAEEKELGANDAKKAAELREQQAKESEKQAEIARQVAEQAKETLAAAQRRSDRVNYARSISLAQQEWQNANITQCEDLLDTSQFELRGWEWDYLKQLCHSETKSLLGLSDTPNRFAFHKDGKHLAGCLLTDSQIRIWDIESGNLVSNSPMHPWAISRDGTTAVGNPASGFQSGMRELSLILSGKVPLTPEHMGRLTIFDVLTGNVISHIVAPGQFGFPHFSWDGSRLVTSDEKDNSIRVWDSKTGTQLARELPTQDMETAATISPDGTKIAWRSTDGTIRVHDATTLDEQIQLNGASGFGFVAFNSDATLVGAPVYDEIQIWNTKFSEPMLILRGHRGNVARCEFSPTMPLIASWGADNTARIWSTETGRELLCLRGHRRQDTSSFPEIAFNSDGTLLATGGGDKMIKIWDVFAGDAPTRILEDGSVKLLDFHNKDAWVLAHCNLRQDLDWVNYGQAVNDIDFTNDGKYLVAASVDGTVKMWDVETRQPGRTFPSVNIFVCSAVRVSPDGKLIAAGYSGTYGERGAGRIVIFASETGEIIHTWDDHDIHVNTLRFNAEGTRLVSAASIRKTEGNLEHNYAELMVWDLKTGKRIRQVPQKQLIITCIDLAPDGKTTAVSGTDGQIHLWDASTGEFIKSMDLPFEVSNSVCFSPDGKTLAAGGDKWNLTLLDVATGSVLWKSYEHSGPIFDVSFAGPDRILTASADGVAKLWDAKTGTSLLTFRDRDKSIHRARMSPDQRTLVCVSDNWRSIRRIPGKTKSDTSDWQVLVNEDFDNGKISDAWSILNGKWSVEDGAAQGIYAVDPRQAALMRKYPNHEFTAVDASAALCSTLSIPSSVEVSYETWSDKPVDCEIKLSNDQNKNDIIALQQGIRGGYFNRGIPGHAIVMRFGENYQEVVTRRAEFKPGQKYRIRALRSDGRWRMYVDEQLVLEAEVPDSSDLPKVVINACHGQDGDIIHIDNVLVRAPKAETALAISSKEK